MGIERERGGDPTLANVARMYDYYLGGAQNFAVDRLGACAVLDAYPHAGVAARANRTFVRHAVRHAIDLGIRQFLDLGSGIPTVGNVHEVARALDPGARVAYVDHEAVAVAHSAALLAGVEGVTITDADLCEPDVVLAGSGVRSVIDLGEPLAVLLAASLSFVPGDVGPVLAAYRRALVPGGVLAISVASADYPDDPDLAAAMTAAAERFRATESPLVLRGRAELRELVGTLWVVPPGIADVSHWDPGRHGPLGMYGVVAEVRPPGAT